MAELISKETLQGALQGIASEMKQHSHRHGENLLRWGECSTYNNPYWNCPVIYTQMYPHSKYCDWELVEDVENTIQGYAEDVFKIVGDGSGYTRYEIAPVESSGTEALPDGVTYTFSYSARKPSESTVDLNTISLQVMYYDTNEEWHYIDNTFANATVIADTTATNGWKRVASTFTLPKGAHNTYAYFVFNTTASGISGTVYFKNLKLEIGAEATGFTRSPFDNSATYDYVDDYCGWLEDGVTRANDVGGRNLLLNSDFRKYGDASKFASTNTNLSFAFVDNWLATTFASNVITSITTPLVLPKDYEIKAKYYTFSFDFYSTTTNSIYPRITLNYTDGTSNFLHKSASGTSKGRYYVTKDLSGDVGKKVSSVELSFQNSPTANATYYVKDLKLEEGKMNTAWVTAMEDKADLENFNLINYSTFTDGYYIGSDGTLATDSTYSVSDYIPVKPNTAYIWQRTSVYDYIATYNSNKEFVAYRNNLDESKKHVVLTFDSNEEYVRLETKTSAINENTLTEISLIGLLDLVTNSEKYKNRNLIAFSDCNNNYPRLAYNSSYECGVATGSGSWYAGSILSARTDENDSTLYYRIGSQNKVGNLKNNTTYTFTVSLRTWANVNKVHFNEYSDTDGYVSTSYDIPLNSTPWSEYTPYSVTHTFNNGSTRYEGRKWIELEFTYNDDYGTTAYIDFMQLEEGTTFSGENIRSEDAIMQTSIAITDSKYAIKTIDDAEAYGDDFNNFTEDGIYLLYSNADPHRLANCPVGTNTSASYRLEVKTCMSSSYIYQVLYSSYGFKWSRALNSNIWSSWKKESMTEEKMIVGDGRNLLRHSVPFVTTEWDSTYFTPSLNGEYLALKLNQVGSGNTTYYNGGLTTVLQVGEVYTLSFEYYATTANPNNHISFYLREGTSNKQPTTRGLSGAYQLPLNSTTPQKVSIPFVATSATAFVPCFYVNCSYGLTTSDYIYIKDLKLEKGNVSAPDGKPSEEKYHFTFGYNSSLNCLQVRYE